MPDARTVASLVESLADDSDGALVKSRDLCLHLLGFTGDPFSRNQFIPGHITCSGLVLAADGSLLLVHHRRLDRWLQPGGHVEPEDVEIWDAAAREVLEETGVELERETRPRLIGADVHGIPPGRGEPYHLHHDLLFGFRAKSKACRVSHESRAVAWAPEAEFDRYSVPANVRRALSRFKLIR
jgi:8-oxo-dGTP pyrophosphatase MutT (NUDIX family)